MSYTTDTIKRANVVAGRQPRPGVYDPNSVIKTIGNYTAGPGANVAATVAKNIANNPTQSKSRVAATAAANAPTTNPYGSESGPGILEQWFNERATGTDPAFEYGLQRGMTSLGNRYSAAGAFNSGAARQGESDLYANLLSQRMGQLDTLAGGASGEHMGRLNQMFGQGTNIANGLSGAGTAYDTAAAGNMSAAAQAQQQMALNKAGVDAKANQGLINNAFNAYALYQGAGRGGGAPQPGTAQPYYNVNNPYPV